MKLPAFDLERFFARFEFDVPFLLGSSDCEAPTLDELLALEPGTAERCRALQLGYSDSQGLRELRREIASLYPSCTPEDVVVHTAAEEVIFVFMNAMLQAGDRVVILTPCFPPLAAIAQSIGCRIEPWRARPEAAWAPDLDELDRLLRPSTRLLVINLPHNPTGWLPDRAFFEEVLALADRHGAFVFSDEIFRLLEHDPATRLPAACDLSVRAASLGGMSKVFGLAGLRVGWLATRDRELRESVVRFKDYTTTCAPILTELLASVGIRQRETILGRNRERVIANVERFREFVERRPGLLDWTRPIAGTVAFPEWKRLGQTDELCENLARERGVLLIPGSTFGMPRHTRVGFGRAGFAEGLERFEEFITKDERFVPRA